MSKIESAVGDISVLEELAERDIWLNHIDPRAKIVITIIFVVLVASFDNRAVMEMVPLASYPIFMFLAGHLPIRILKRPLLIAVGFAVLIGAANPILDTEAVFLREDLAVKGGWLSFFSIVLRAVLCVSAAAVLIATTGMTRLCRGLSGMGVPNAIVVQLLFLYRYALLLGGSAVSMSRARDLRGGGKTMSLPVYGSLMGHLLLRTLDRAERIHMAMRCRGFRGTVPVVAGLSFGFGDAGFVGLWAMILAALRWGAVLHGVVS